MRAVVAYRDADDSPEALELALTLRRTTGCELVVAAVLPRTSVDAGEDRAPDAEYRAWLDSVAADAEAAARAVLDSGGEAVAFVRVQSSSVAAGLLRAVADADADVLVVGSARAAVAGSLVAGSVATRLLHSSEVPLLLAPHGYRDTGEPFASITCAYAGESSREALAASCELAKRFRSPLWVTTFVVRARTMHTAPAGSGAEDLVADQAAEQAADLHAEAVAYCHELGVDDVRSFIARGSGWEETLRNVDWDAHDILVFGSSRLAPITRVFLGSTATKILRHTPVPALVLPAGSYHWRD